jgi:hypothetical protein
MLAVVQLTLACCAAWLEPRVVQFRVRFGRKPIHDIPALSG